MHKGINEPFASPRQQTTTSWWLMNGDTGSWSSNQQQTQREEPQGTGYTPPDTPHPTRGSVYAQVLLNQGCTAAGSCSSTHSHTLATKMLPMFQSELVVLSTTSLHYNKFHDLAWDQSSRSQAVTSHLLTLLPSNNGTSSPAAARLAKVDLTSRQDTVCCLENLTHSLQLTAGRLQQQHKHAGELGKLPSNSLC